MKKLAILLGAVTLFACKKDNYDPPASKLTGRVVYQGEPIQLEFNQVPFQLYQYGFGKVGPVSNTTFTQEGTFSVLLFDGEYKLIIPDNQGPFLWKKNGAGAPDTVVVNMSGNKELDLEVMPFYMIRDHQFSAAAGKVTGTFKIEKIITDAGARNVERVNLYINKTAFVSGNGANYSIASASISGGNITDMNNVSMTVTVPELVPAQSYVFARIGLKVAGVEDMIFSPIVKLSL
ncbi:hypothetical protein DLD77_03460 [Chitinophaga alhagiae]|uniref:DUF3823 domain-containing protein n=1 Tax=Chitinophaga alhagiae TaxID=2203219 RepID=A0ABN5LN45_9BACT|nr:DUF3823 domain-containing protein [Chitinophaga alhagiae]AWO00817.1 hypothetical protein DLD77_03460 [Chitinophaga alhagiae]